jgi:hypothetical protein
VNAVRLLHIELKRIAGGSQTANFPKIKPENMNMKKLAVFLTTAALLAGTALAVDPKVGNVRGYGDSPQWIKPMGAQRGSEVDVTINGYRLTDAQEVMFYEPGIEVISVTEPKDRTVKAKFRIAKDARLGEYRFRVRTATGISQVRTFNVGPFANVDEKEPNNEFSEAQELKGNVTVEGRVDSEEIDYFKVTAKKGERISAEVEGIRLNMTLFDPYVAIQKMDGEIIAESDDTSLHLQDPAVTVIAPADGTYIVQVREAAYGGGRYSYYRAHIGSFPRPQAVFPAGGKAGETIKVKFLGDASGDFEQEIKLPAEPTDDFGIAAVRDGVVSPSLNAFRVSPFDNVFEVEPNNDVATATKTATPVPAAFNGIISEEGDIDYFRFNAKKGQSFHVRAHAQKIRSGLDPLLYIYDGKGKYIAGNDDSGGADSYFRFTPAADGEYVIRVSDHLKRGRPDFTYRLELTPFQPSYALSIPHVARRDSQTRQAVVVHKGNRFTTMMNVSRQNGLRGDLKFHIPNLPKGVKLISDVMPANVTSFPLTFEATKDAAVGGTFVFPEVLAIADGKESPIAEGGLNQQIDLVHASPNATVYKIKTLDKLPIVVAAESPYRIELTQPKAPIVQYGIQYLEVNVIKKEGWDGDVYAFFPFRPPGVSASSYIKIAKGQTKAKYRIDARYNAQVRSWKVCVQGRSAVGGGELWTASNFIDLEILPRLVLGKFETASCVIGDEVTYKCKLDHKVEFDGKAKLTLYSLPANCTATPVEITKDSKEAVFTIKTTDKSRAGVQKTVYWRMTAQKNGEPMDFIGATSGRLIITKPKVEEAEKKDDKKKVALAK